MASSSDYENSEANNVAREQEDFATHGRSDSYSSKPPVETSRDPSPRPTAPLSSNKGNGHPGIGEALAINETAAADAKLASMFEVQQPGGLSTEQIFGSMSFEGFASGPDSLAKAGHPSPSSSGKTEAVDSLGASSNKHESQPLTLLPASDTMPKSGAPKQEVSLSDGSVSQTALGNVVYHGPVYFNEYNESSGDVGRSTRLGEITATGAQNIIVNELNTPYTVVKEIIGGEPHYFLHVKGWNYGPGSFDFETHLGGRDIHLRATAADGTWKDLAFHVDYANVDEVPLVSFKQTLGIVEFSASAGANVGTITAIAPERADKIATSVTILNDTGAFAVVREGNTWVLKIANGTLINYEDPSTYTLEIQASYVGTSAAVLWTTTTVVLNVTNANEGSNVIGGINPEWQSFWDTDNAIPVFQNITLTDGDNLQVTVDLGALNLGTLTSSSGGSFDGQRYTISGSASFVQEALHNLRFDPKDRPTEGYTAGQPVHFTVSVWDGFTTTVNSDTKLSIHVQNRAPTAVTLDHNKVWELTPSGTDIGILGGIDQAGDVAFTYKLVNNEFKPFAIVTDAGVSKLVTLGTVDYESTLLIPGHENGVDVKYYNVEIEITDIHGGSAVRVVKVYVDDVVGGDPVNNAPTLADLPESGLPFWDTDHISVFAGATIGDVDGDILTVTVTMVDHSLGVFEFDTGSYDQARGVYTISGDATTVQDAIRALKYNPNDRPTDSVGQSAPTLFVISVFDGAGFSVLNEQIVSYAHNRAPTEIRLSNNHHVHERVMLGTAIGDLTAVDPNFGDTNFTYKLLNNDGKPFAIDMSWGYARLVTSDTIDYEAGGPLLTKTDINGNVVGKYYEVEIEVSNLNLTLETWTQTIQVFVDDELGDMPQSPKPSDIGLSDNWVREGTGRSGIGTLTTANAGTNPPDSYKYNIVTTTMWPYLEVFGDSLTLVQSFDWEGVSGSLQPPKVDYNGKYYEVVIRSTADYGEGTHFDKTFKIYITDISEHPTNATPEIHGADQLENHVVRPSDWSLPFLNVTFLDPESQNITVTIAMDHPGQGRFVVPTTLPDNGSYDAIAGVYTITGSAAAVADAIHLLQFDPLGNAETTNFAITVSDGNFSSRNTNISITATTNQAPTEISLSGIEVREGLPGAHIGTLDTNDHDAGDTITWDVASDAGGRFFVEDGILKTTAALDFESTDEFIQYSFNGEKYYVIEISATDRYFETVTKTFSIFVTNFAEDPLNHTPEIRGADSTLPITVVDTDSPSLFAGVTITDDENNPLTVTIKLDHNEHGWLIGAGLSFDSVREVYTLSGYASALTATLQALQFDPRGRPNAENGDLELTRFSITVSDGNTSVTNTNISVDSAAGEITNQSPTAIHLSPSTVAEADTETLIGILTTDDPDVTDTVFEYHLETDAGGRFGIQGDQLVRLLPLDYESDDEFLTWDFEGAYYEIMVRSVDTHHASTTKPIRIYITDLTEDGNNQTPTIGGAGLPTSQPVDDDKVISPFAAITFVDIDSLSITVTITMDKPSQGSFDSAFYNELTHVYRITGTVADVQAAVQALKFNPRDRPTDPVGTHEITNFSIVVSDGNSSSRNTNISVDASSTDPTDPTGNNVPHDLFLDGGTSVHVLENLTAVGNLSAIDADSGDTLSYAIVSDPDGMFVIVGDAVQGYKLRVAPYMNLDFDFKTSHTVTIRVSDGHEGGYTDQTFTINVDEDPNELNHAPTDLTLDHDIIAENSIWGTKVGTLHGVDQDLTDTLIYTLAQDDDDKFVIVGNELRLRKGATLNFEDKKFHDIVVRVTDLNGTGESYDRAFRINVEDVDNPEPQHDPTGAYLTRDFVFENLAPGAEVGIVVGLDQDGGDVLTYTLIDASGRFDLSTADGVTKLVTKVVLDYDDDPTLLKEWVHGVELRYHNVEVQVSDGFRTKNEVLKVYVNDVTNDVALNHAPTDITLANNTARESATSTTLVGELIMTDADATDQPIYRLLDDAGGRFYLDGNEIRIANGKLIDYEQKRDWNITVEVNDGKGGFFEKVIGLVVRNVGAENVTGTNFSEKFVGGSRGDKLTGVGGNDTLVGGLGNDTLDGGDGADVFVFNTKANTTTNMDTIKVFDSIDQIQLTKSPIVFALAGLGELTEVEFSVGAQAASATTRIIYDDQTGKLYYDANGNVAGGQVQFAILQNKPTLTYHNFFVI